MKTLPVLLALLTSVPLQAQKPPPIDRAVLEKLMARGKETHSAALLVWQHGKLVAEDYFGTPLHRGSLMSCTKSVVALAVAKLVDAGKIRSFDQPVSDFYPEWKQGQKRNITLRHLLTHTSGLQNEPNTTVEIYPAPDGIKLALAAELSDPPGTRFAYNNKAMNLIAGVIAQVSGQRMDRYIAEQILQPLGIRDASWEADNFDKAGTPYAMAGLSLSGAEFLQIGRLVLGNGAVEGKRIISEKSMQALVGQGSPVYPGYGLLWWRIPKWHVRVVDEARLADMKRAGLDERFIAAMATLKDQPLAEADLPATLRKALGDDWLPRVQAARAKTQLLTDKWSPEFVGVNANGYLGQYLIVLPAAQLIAVRLVDGGERYDDKTDGFEDFFDQVRALVESPPSRR
jgi:CubicO group peptidase (beta-lactamase class C family)